MAVARIASMRHSRSSKAKIANITPAMAKTVRDKEQRTKSAGGQVHGAASARKGPQMATAPKRTDQSPGALPPPGTFP